MTTSSTNYTGLYSGNVSGVIPNTAYGNANVVSLLAVGTDGANTVGNISATGNVSANYFIGNGSQLTGIVSSSYGNAQVASFLSAFGSNTISTTGNVTSGNLLTGGAVSATGNVSGAYIFGNGSQLTGLPATYSNANVTTLLAAFGSNSILTTGNITAGNFAGNGSQLTAIAGANVTGTVANATYATSAGSATTAGTVTANAQPNITSTGTLSTLSVSGNTTSGNLLTPGTISATGNITTAGYFVGTFQGNISGNLTVPGANTDVLFNNQGNAGASNNFTFDSSTNVMNVTGSATVTGNITGGNVSTAGNVTASYILGNGSQLTAITGANVTGTVANATYALTSNAATYASVATFADTANAVAGANVSGTVANAAYATSAGSATTAVTANTVTDPAQANITSVGTLTSVSVSGNTTTGNLLTAGVVSATGNITGSYIIGNGSQLTGLPAGYSNANATSLLAAFGSNTISTTGNVDTGNLTVGQNAVILGNLTVQGTTITVNSNTVTINDKFINVANNAATPGDANGGGIGVGPVGSEYATLTFNSAATAWNTNIPLSVTGNISGGNVLASGAVSAVGNITGSYIIGNGSLLTDINASNIVGSYGNAQVASFLNAFGSNSISTTGNITSAYISGNGSLLTSITGANVTGTVANATYATTAGTATFAGTANAVAGANVSGTVANATYATTAGSATTATTANTVINGAQANITSVGTLTSLSVTGNANISGNINMPTADANITLGAVALRNYNNRLYVNTDADINGRLSASGNVQGNYILGNGSQLTGLPAGYSNADVTTLLASFGSNTISTTGNITAGNLVGIGSLTSLSVTGNANVSGNINLPTADANITFGAVAIRNYNNRLYVNTDADINGRLSASSNVIGSNLVTAGYVTATGNVSGAYILGNGSQLTGLPATYGNANVSNFLANGFGSNTIVTTGNITGGNLLTGGASGNITGVNYVNANYFVGNGALLTGVANLVQIQNGTSNVSIPTTNGPANVVVGGTTRASFSQFGLLENGWISATGNIDGANIIAASDITANGNIAGTNLNLSGGITATGSALNIGTITATGNIRTTGGYFLGDGGFLSNVAAGASIQNGTSNVVAYANSNVAVSVGGTSNVAVFTTTGQLVTGIVSATGNITGGNMLGGIFSATGNITTGQSTIVGTANTTGGVGNIILSGKNIATDMPRNPDSATGTTADAARIVIGTGFNGNVSPGSTPQNGGTQGSRLYIGDAFNRGNAAIQARTVYISDFTTLTANVTNQGMRINGLTVQPVIGGGSAGNTITGTVFTIAGLATIPTLGGGLTGNLTSLGNTTAQYVVAQFAGVTVNQGSSAGNAISYLSQMGATSGGGNFANTMIGVSQNASGNITPTTYISYHQPSNVASYGASLSNFTRAAANYYFLKNDDAAAQAQIGSLRSYSEFNYTNTATSGAVTIDKTNAQVQQVNLTGNVTSLTYSNFVSSASDGTNTDEQADTVTIIFNQGATGGYGVTFPSGSAYKYAGGTNTLSATTANSVTLVAITAIRISGTTTYLTTISPAFT